MRIVAWLGGAVFVAALTLLIHFYAVTLSRSDGDPRVAVPHVAINLALFSVFALHHSLLARTSAKRFVTALVTERAERLLYVWVASGLLIAVCLLWRSVPGVVYEVAGVWRLPLYAVQAAGVILTIGGARVIDPLSLAGIRQASLQATDDPLRIVGPFRFIRHPIYLGWILIVGGAPTMTANRLLFAAMSSAYLILAIPWEEKSLVAVHGDQYRAYQRQVRWRVAPGIW